MMVIMRYPGGHKQEVRERIVAAASAALRARGLAGVSIPELMKEAGLTHGGFYTHFDDRDELVADAITHAGEETAQAVFAGTTLEEMLCRYLAPEHLAHPDRGCVVSALGTEGGKHSARVSSAFAHVARGLLRLVDAKISGESTKRSKPLSDEALRVAATMVGAIVLGRLVDDARLAERILRVARASAKAR